MSIENIKKQSKRLKNLWPSLTLARSEDDISLSQAQEIVARQYNYANYHAALTASQNVSSHAEENESGNQNTTRGTGQGKPKLRAEQLFFSHPNTIFPNGEIHNFISAASAVSAMIRDHLIPAEKDPAWGDSIVNLEQGVYAIPFKGQLRTGQQNKDLKLEWPKFDCESSQTVHLLYSEIHHTAPPKAIDAQMRKGYAQWLNAQPNQNSRADIITLLASENEGNYWWTVSKYASEKDQEASTRPDFMPSNESSWVSYVIPVEKEVFDFSKKLIDQGTLDWYERVQLRNLTSKAYQMGLLFGENIEIASPMSFRQTMDRASVVSVHYDAIFQSIYAATYLGAIGGVVQIEEGGVAQDLMLDLARTHCAPAIGLKTIRWTKPK